MSASIFPKAVIFGLLGPNGAGKTSLIRIINQITGPDSGEVLFDGKPLNDSHIQRIGYLPEERGLYKKMKVGDQLLYLARLKGLSKNEAMDRLKIWFTKFDIKTWWDKQVADLSKGMQQKVQFVSTVLHEPDLIILDEPFSGFDPINANLIRDEILELREKGSTIIFSTHRHGNRGGTLRLHRTDSQIEKGTGNGPKKQIKEQFKTNTYFVEYSGTLYGIGEHFDVQNARPADRRFPARRHPACPAGTTPNQLLQELLPRVEIHSFGENIPHHERYFHARRE